MRAAVLAKYPYYWPIVYGLRYIEEPAVGTLAVNKKMQLFFSPEYVASLSHEEGGGALWHEIQHVTDSFHLPDEVQKDPMTNIATDLHINCRGKGIGVTLPPNVFYPEKYGFPPYLSSMQYLELLRKQDKDPGAGRGVAQGACWSSAAVDEKHAEDAPNEVDRAVAAETLAREVVAYATKHQGSVPAGLLEWARVSRARAKVPWNRLLNGHLRMNLSHSIPLEGEETYNRPDELAFVDPKAVVLLPGEERFLPVVVLILDTSGSMSMAEFEIAARETRGVLRSLHIPSLRFLCADTQVGSDEELSLKELEKEHLKIVGRGGTSFVQPLEYVKKHDPSVVVYVTDGYGDFPDRRPTFPVIWVMTSDVRAPFGVTVKVDR